MSVLFLLIFFFIAILGKMIKNKVDKKVYLFFNTYWAILIFLTLVIPYGGYKISTNTYLILFIFVLSINIGFFVGGYNKKKANNKSTLDFNKSYEYLQNNKIVKKYFIVSVIVLIYYAIVYSNTTDAIGGAEARNLRFYVGELFNSTGELLFYNNIISPSRYLASFYVAISFFKNKIQIKKIIIPLIIIILSSYIGGGRFEVIYFMFCIIMANFLKSNKSLFKITRGSSILNLKECKRFILFTITIIAVIFIMIYLTAYRTNEYEISLSNFQKYGEVLSNQIVNYNIGSFGAFDISLQNGSLNHNYFLGRATILGGVEDIIQYALSYIGISFTSVRTEIGITLNSVINIGNTTFNALYTALYYFYSDYGIMGIFLFPFIFGYIFRNFLIKYDKNKNVFLIAIIFHLFYQYMIMNLNWYLTAADTLIYFIILFLLHKGYKKKI